MIIKEYSSMLNHKNKTACLIFVFFLLLTACHKDVPHTTEPKNQEGYIFSPSWTIITELHNLQEPVRVASELHYYEEWVGTPKLPNDVIDVGFRHQPNPEILSQLPIKSIIDSSWYVNARSLYGSTPVTSVEFAITDKQADWQDFVTTTKKLAEIIEKPMQAESYIKNSEQELLRQGRLFQEKNPNIQKIAIMQFQDAQTVRLYAENSLVNLSLVKMGLQQEVLGEKNGWGFSTVPITALTKLDKETCVVIIEPHTLIIQKKLEKSLIWQRLDYGDTRCIGTISTVWLYGGINSIVSFAKNLNDAKFKGGVAKAHERQVNL